MISWRCFLIALLSVVLVACQEDRSGLTRVELTDGSQMMPLWVEIADEPQEQAQGLMGRTELASDSGMLFIFAEPRVLSFWMKNTLIPLDILFFDAQGGFVAAKSMAPCERDPCMTYSSGKRAKYALEVNEGFLGEEGIGAGWELRMENEQ
jgi:uncharacterized membrane protein (UPF0127 family)